jgi:transcriptional regulator with XRE-family HTH domain
MKLHKYLQTQRLKKGITQLQIASAVNLHVQYISNVERGKCAIPIKIINTYIRELELNSNNVLKVMVNEYRDNLKRLLL